MLYFIQKANVLSRQVSDRNYTTNIQKHFLNTQTIFLVSLKL